MERTRRSVPPLIRSQHRHARRSITKPGSLGKFYNISESGPTQLTPGKLLSFERNGFEALERIDPILVAIPHLDLLVILKSEIPMDKGVVGQRLFARHFTRKI